MSVYRRDRYGLVVKQGRRTGYTTIARGRRQNDNSIQMDRFFISSEDFQANNKGLELNLKPNKYIGRLN